MILGCISFKFKKQTAFYLVVVVQYIILLLENRNSNMSNATDTLKKTATKKFTLFCTFPVVNSTDDP
jgi:citrate lyase synthetase